MASAVTARYVEALFQLALERGSLEEVASDVQKMGAEVSVPEVTAFLSNARVTNAEKVSRLEPLLATLNEAVANFVRLLFDKSRGEVLIEAGEAFRLRVLDHRGATEGRVESARSLDPAQIDELAAAIGRQLGKDVILKNEVDPSLVGGARVFVDNRMIDNSVQGRLGGLQRKLREARLGAG
jgi:F-type H+-transporting ATPase subunit delta